MTVETLQTPITAPLPPPQPVAVEGLYSPETTPFKTSDEAATYIRTAAMVLTSGRPSSTEVKYTPRYRSEPPQTDLAISLKDGFGKYDVQGLDEEVAPDDHRTTTSISYTTKLPNGQKSTSTVFREQRRHLSGGTAEDKGVVYSVSKEEDNTLDGVYEPTLTRTQPGELTKDESAEAEKRYIEMATQFRIALELRMARTDPDAIGIIKGSVEAQKASKVRGFMKNLGLLKR